MELEVGRLGALKVAELKQALQDRGLNTDGLKADLIERLTAALQAGGDGSASGRDPAVAGGAAADANGAEGAGMRVVSEQVSEAAAHVPAADPDPAQAPAQWGAQPAAVPAAVLLPTPLALAGPADAAPVAAGHPAAASTANVAQDPTAAASLAVQATAGSAPGASDADAQGSGAKRGASQMEGGAAQVAPEKRPAIAPDPNLPAPWTEHFSQRTGKPYWYNPETKETTWHYPGRKAEPAAAKEQQVAAPEQQPYAQQHQYAAYAVGGVAMAGPNAGCAMGPTGLPLRPGQEECKHFLRFGMCKFGQLCKYDHPPEKAGVDGQQDADKYYIAPDGTRSAKIGVKTGAMKLANNMAQTGGLPVRPGEKECSFFMRNGMCQYGETCRWHHPPERQSAVPQLVPMPAGVGMGGMPGMAAAAASVWETHLSNENRPYYYNTSTGESTWEMPPALMMQMMGMMGGGVGAGNGAAPTLPAAELNAGGHPIRPGVTECAFYVKTGGCKFGATCKFHHPPEYLGIGAAGAAAAAAPPGTGVPGVAGGVFQQMQPQPFASMGNGSSSFMGQGMAAVARTREGFPIRPGQPDCAFYMRTGQCKFSDTCKFNHPEKGITGLPDATNLNTAPVWFGNGTPHNH